MVALSKRQGSSLADLVARVNKRTGRTAAPARSADPVPMPALEDIPPALRPAWQAMQTELADLRRTVVSLEGDKLVQQSMLDLKPEPPVRLWSP